MTDVFLHIDDGQQREQVAEYLEACRKRTAESIGFVPNNGRLSGGIGAYTDGKQDGDFYGGSWDGWHYTGIEPTSLQRTSFFLRVFRVPCPGQMY